jgi:hypothetical protein
VNLYSLPTHPCTLANAAHSNTLDSCAESSILRTMKAHLKMNVGNMAAVPKRLLIVI